MDDQIHIEEIPLPVPTGHEDGSPNDPEDTSKSELWDQIGYHKQIGGFWYNLVLTFFGIALSMVVFGYLIGFFYPYPESLGMKDIAFTYFSLMFVLFDVGTGAVMGRFIPEVNIKDTQKMIHYTQYFIWYQMITGLIQTTAVSIYALFFAPQTTMAYTVWIMLICSTTQYPGFLGVFRNVLDALQHYDKTRILNFVSNTVIQTITQYLFLYLGRIYGESNPMIGPILGIAIGAAIGSYVDDFFATMLSVHFFNKVLRTYGISSKSCFYVEFTWEEVKPMLIYSLKTGLPGLITSSISYMGFLLYVENIPQYTTITFLAITGGSIADVLNWFGQTNITPLVSESYMNDKPALTQYYMGQDVRFNTFLLSFFVPIILVVREVMPIAYVELGMAQYAISVIFILPRLIRLCCEKFFGMPGAVMYGANKPNFGIIMGLIHSGLDLGVKYLLLVVWAIPKNYGLLGTVMTMEFGHLPLSIIVAGIGYWYVNKNIIKIKMPFKQIFMGFILPAAITYLVCMGVKIAVFDTLFNAFGFFVALFPAMFLIVASVLLVYIPLTGILGGWDDVNLEEFRKAALMSGPSKFLVWQLYKMLKWSCEHSKLHNKYRMETEQVLKDAEELFNIKKANRAKFVETQ